VPWDEGLDGPHLEIAASEAARVGVLAGPGTGKTKYGLMRRVARFLSLGVPGTRILLISFTRVAAADLRDKVAELDVPGADLVRATTLHGYCLGLLMRDSVLALTGRHPRILMNHERDLMLRDIDGDFGSIHDRRRRLEALLAGWARRESEHPGVAAEGPDRDFERRVLRWLVSHRAMLIGEVVPIAHRYLSTNPAAEELQALDHLVVDEYQDLNFLEQNLLEVLSSNATTLCVAGDDDQSIYSLRYANPSGIRNFLSREDVEPHGIKVCGRSPANVVEMANSLIEQSAGRDKPPLVPLAPDRLGDVSIVQWADVPSEIDGIVSAIADDVGRREIEPGEILVLTNWRGIGERIRERLADLGIPIRSYFTEEELASDEGREAVALLRLVVDEHDLPAVRVLLGLGEASGRSGAYQRLLEHCHSNGLGVLETLGVMVAGERVGDLRVPALVERYRKAALRIEHLKTLGVPELVEQLFPPGQEALADLRGIALDSRDAAEGAADVLDAIVVAVTQDDVPQHPNFVRVMSLHKSKGLTAHSVYIVGAVDGILPTVTSTTSTEMEAAVEEGRRLFYVALTRATSEVVISTSTTMDLADANARGVRYANTTIRRSGGRFTVRTIASPYIAELGPSAPDGQRGDQWLASRAGQ
jgi:DNA helicase-2/ATP-dependent DNA helicase PcrA